MVKIHLCVLYHKGVKGTVLFDTFEKNYSEIVCMRYPLFLEDGGRIGFIAPSFGCATEPYRSDFEESLEWFRDMGYETVLGPNCFSDEGVGISNTPAKCAAEAGEFLTEDKSDVIISCGGGELMCEILPYMDFEKIASSNPKWFMGYSDNTNLTFLLNTLADTASIYSVCASKFTKEHHRCVDDAFDILCGRNLTVSNYDVWFKDTYGAPEDPDDKTGDDRPARVGIYRNEKTGETMEMFSYKQYLYRGTKPTDEVSLSGRLIGGCMDCLVNLVGTRFDKAASFADRYKDDGIIWFLESCDLSVMAIRRALWQMEMAGWFKHTAGFLIGRPLRFDETFGDFDHYDAVLGILGKYDVPILMDLDIGHQFPQMPLISGAYANITASADSIRIEHILK